MLRRESGPCFIRYSISFVEISRAIDEISAKKDCFHNMEAVFQKLYNLSFYSVLTMALLTISPSKLMLIQYKPTG